MKIKPSQNGKITLSFTKIKVNHSLVAKFEHANMSFNAIRENKIITNISEFTLCFSFQHYTFSEEMALLIQTQMKINYILAHHSPVLIVQKFVRGFLTRKRSVFNYFLSHGGMFVQ